MDLVTILSSIASVPNPNPGQPPGMGNISTIMNWVMWIGLAMCVVGIIAGGTMMAIQSRRGEGGEHVGRIGMALGGVVVIGAAGALVGFLAG